jgi:phage gp29-like protein
MPTVMGKFSRGLPSEEHTAMLAALQDLHRATAIMHPSDIDVSLIGGGKEASAGFMEALDFHNREIARAVLGQTLATDEGRRVGSLAMGRVHLQVLILQLEALRRELADVVMTEQVIRPLVEMNFGPVPIPRFEFEPTMLSAFTTGSM